MENGQQVGITPNDLQSLAAIVKVAIKRGAFEAEEISHVGAVYDKLTAFIASIKPAAAEAPATEDKGEKNAN